MHAPGTAAAHPGVVQPGRTAGTEAARPALQAAAAPPPAPQAHAAPARPRQNHD
jgi:hypothetical protein